MGCVLIQISFQGITIRKGNEKRLQGFLYLGLVALSNKGGCVVETSLGFSVEWPPLILWIMRVYII